jgi:TatD DNase family protein
MFDSHCHPYLSKNNTSENIVSSFRKSWWDYLISIWIDIETSRTSVKLANKYDKVFASIWIQPTYTIKYKWKLENEMKLLEKLYLDNKKNIIWIWECWLDYHWIPSLINDSLDKNTIIKIQKDFFKAQIYLAKKYNLPVIIHNRDAKEDILYILKYENYKNFIIHCFSEDLYFAKQCLNFAPNCMISFSWIITFKNSKKIQETAKNIPLKNILIETDSPYLTPVPYRWKQENKPELVKYILEKIIELRSEDSKTIKDQIIINSLKIFNIK